MKRLLLDVMTACAVLLVGTVVGMAAEAQFPNLSDKKDLVIKRGFTKDALACIECHAKKMPGIVEAWKQSRMSHAGIACYDCHVVEKRSPMASQCEGVKGTQIFISPMVSSKTCSRCHPQEVEQFSKSGHAVLAGMPVCDPKKLAGKMLRLMYENEGAAFMDDIKLTLDGLTPKDMPPSNRAARASGCQMCHGTQVELGPDNKPINETWPGGVGMRYPDGSIGNCTVCHTRHKFSIADARKPEACGACHLGPDHPNIEIYFESKHGQQYLAHGDEWRYDSAPDTWEPGDYTAPTCATCHMSGIGELATTHNINDRLKWDLVHKKSVLRSGERGDGAKADVLMRKVCVNCHSRTHTDIQMNTLDNAVALYNKFWDGAVKMKQELGKKGLLKKDAWKDGFQELMYYLWHHTGRRARQGAAMNAPDYAHWHGFFQIFQLYKDMEDLYEYRMKNNTFEPLSPVMSTGPY
ncbi:MAG: beta-ketoacyl-ACP synthase [Deltaproteobacteria bacterium]|nr:beta-ketoacyl-ACP synthase [Deltaproteobacteria bacterium]